jgi:hypothetical protein
MSKRSSNALSVAITDSGFICEWDNALADLALRTDDEQPLEPEPAQSI